MRKNSLLFLILSELLIILYLNPFTFSQVSVFAADSAQPVYLVIKPDFGGQGYDAFYPQVITVQQGSQVNITVRNLSSETFHLSIADFANATIGLGVTKIAVFTAATAGVFSFQALERSDLMGQFVVLPTDWSKYDPTPLHRNYTQIVKPDFAGDSWDKFISSVMVANQGDNVSISIRNTDDAPHGFALTSYGINIGVNPGTDLQNGTISSTITKVETFTASTPGIFWFECTTYCGPGHPYMVGTFIVLPRGGQAYKPETFTRYRYLTIKSDYGGDGYSKFVPNIMFFDEGDLGYIMVRNTDTHEFGFSLPSFNLNNITIESANTTTLTPTDNFITVFSASKPGIFEFYCGTCGHDHHEMNGYVVILPRLNATVTPFSRFSSGFSFTTFVFVSAGMVLAGVVIGLVVLSRYSRQKEED